MLADAKLTGCLECSFTFSIQADEMISKYLQMCKIHNKYIVYKHKSLFKVLKNKIKVMFSSEEPPLNPTLCPLPPQGVSATITPHHVTSTSPSTWRPATWAEACARTVNTTRWADSASSARRSSSSTRTETCGTRTSASVSHLYVTSDLWVLLFKGPLHSSHERAVKTSSSGSFSPSGAAVKPLKWKAESSRCCIMIVISC